MMKTLSIMFFSIALMCTAGCITTGGDFPSDLAWIKKDSTTKKDVQLILGPPFAVGNSSGVITWTYAYFKYDLLGKSAHKELKFYWNSDHSIKHFSFNSSFPADLPSSQRNRRLRSKYAGSKIKKENGFEHEKLKQEFQRF